MKTIMLRGLDGKPEVKRIVEEYMALPRVNTTSAPTAIESFIRQFDRNGKDNLEYRQRAEQELHELRDEVAKLTWERGVEIRKKKTFREAFKDLMSES